MWKRKARTNKNKEREAVSVSAHPELFEVLIHMLPPSLFPLCSASSRDHGLPSFNLVSHSETQYQSRYEQKWETQDCLSTDNCVHCGYLCHANNWCSIAISFWVACLSACCLSIRPKTYLRTAVFPLLCLTRQDSHFVSLLVIAPAGRVQPRSWSDHSVTVNTTQMCLHTPRNTAFINQSVSKRHQHWYISQLL